MQLQLSYPRGHKWKKPAHKFRVLQVNETEIATVQDTSLVSHFWKDDWLANIRWGTKNSLLQFKSEIKLTVSDNDLSYSLEYMFKRVTIEVKHFVKPEKIGKMSFEKDKILFCRSRLLDGQRFIMTSGLEETNLLHPSDLNMMTPILDRFSPLAYSIAEFIHRVHSKHAGYETCYRMSLNLTPPSSLLCPSLRRSGPSD